MHERKGELFLSCINMQGQMEDIKETLGKNSKCHNYVILCLWLFKKCNFFNEHCFKVEFKQGHIFRVEFKQGHFKGRVWVRA